MENDGENGRRAEGGQEAMRGEKIKCGWRMECKAELARAPMTAQRGVMEDGQFISQPVTQLNSRSAKQSVSPKNWSDQTGEPAS